MTDFSKIRFDDATIRDLRVLPDAVEVTYLDWQERPQMLVFRRAIACFSASPFNRSLSHGTIEASGEYLVACCEAADEENIGMFTVFNFVESWGDRTVLRVVATEVEQRSPVVA